MAGTQTSTNKKQNNPQVEELRRSPTMAHLLDSLEQGTDVGHYGRLVFIMVARHFLDEDELVQLLSNQPDHDENDMRATVQQVIARGYSPPKRERIMEWQSQQDFQICPESDDPDSCNVYRELNFPQEVYDHISEYYEEKANS